MKYFISASFLLISIFTLVFCSGSVSADHEKKQMSNKNNNIIVLELFTSQGCSSCPSADRLLASYANRGDIVALSFHVDYWNRLGWKDPFSSEQFSKRQSNYASSFGASGVYTPQIVINGEKQMVGSDEDKIASTIKQMQKQQSVAQIIIDTVKTENNKVLVTYSVNGKFNKSVLNIALVQNKITTNIKSGENGGVTLTNYNVVRSFATVNLFDSGKNIISIDNISGVDKNNLSIILFLQDASTNKISAAVKSSL